MFEAKHTECDACSIQIDVGDARFYYSHNGRNYIFCSKNCRSISRKALKDSGYPKEIDYYQKISYRTKYGKRFLFVGMNHNFKVVCVTENTSGSLPKHFYKESLPRRLPDFEATNKSANSIKRFAKKNSLYFFIGDRDED